MNPELHVIFGAGQVGRPLARLLVEDSDAYGRPWMLPCAPAETLRALSTRLARHLDRTIAVAQVPRWMLRLAAVFVPFVRELDEMLYQWDEPFVVDDRRFRERFRQPHTDMEVAAAATVAWARHHYGTPR